MYIQYIYWSTIYISPVEVDINNLYLWKWILWQHHCERCKTAAAAVYDLFQQTSTGVPLFVSPDSRRWSPWPVVVWFHILHNPAGRPALARDMWPITTIDVSTAGTAAKNVKRENDTDVLWNERSDWRQTHGPSICSMFLLHSSLKGKRRLYITDDSWRLSAQVSPAPINDTLTMHHECGFFFFFFNFVHAWMSVTPIT